MVDKSLTGGVPKITPELWWKVYDRDHRRCIAPQLDPDVSASTCRNRWGNSVEIHHWGTRPYDLTYAHIKDGPGGPRIHDEKHAVICCWQHHVQGRGPDAMWVTSARGLELVRAYLAKLYPDV